MERRNVVSIRFSDAELAALRAAAKREIRPVCGFLRWAALQAAQRAQRPTAGQEASE